MLVDDLRTSLKQLQPDVQTIQNFWEKSPKEERFAKLSNQAEQEDFWQHPQQATILKELQALKIQKEQYESIVQGYQELTDLITLFENDETELHKLIEPIKEFVHKVRRFKINLVLSKPEDDLNCFVSINAGAGGTESQDWANILLRMYLRFCERENLKADLVDYQQAEEAGIKSATLFIKGKKAYGLLKSEHGIHRLVRISPFDASKRRHTSFSGIFVIPEFQESEIEINTQDLRIDTYRASGAGGQHINTTDSAVRITHLPTGTVVQCQNERSQTQNKETAMKMLKARLIQKQKEESEAKKASIEKKKIEWGSQIRSYVLHPYKLVKDHRTNFESPQPDKVLDGELMSFIEEYLITLAHSSL